MNHTHNLIDPKTDFAFRKLFGSNTERSREILLSLVNAFLTKDRKMVRIKEIEAINPYNLADFDESKESILDIKAFDERGNWYNIEMQAASDPEYFRRALFYWAKVYTSALSKGEKYSKLKRTIGIHFLDFDCIDSLKSKYHNIFGITNLEDPNIKAYGTEMLEIHLIELRKFKRQNIPINTSREEWAQFFVDTKECFKNESKLKTPEVKKALDDLDKLKLKGKERELYEASLKRLSDQNTLMAQAKKEGVEEGKIEGIKEGIEKGMEKGREEGEKQAAISIAKTLKSQGLTTSQIAVATGLKEEEIKKL